MLRSVGYFSGIECPSEGEKDGCCRPYCPFRHQIDKDHSTNQDDVAGTSSVTIDAVNDAIKKLKSDIAEDSTLYNNPMLNETYSPEHYSPSGEQTNSYKPTEYRPSKNNKSVLHGARGATKNINYGSSNRHQGGIDYKSNIQTQPLTDMEYDPVVNYSTMISKSTSKAKPKRNHSDRDDTGIPSKKSRIADDTNLSNPFSSTEEDDDGLIINEEQEENIMINESESCQSDNTDSVSHESTTENTSENESIPSIMKSNKSTPNEKVKNKQSQKSSTSKKISNKNPKSDKLKSKQKAKLKNKAKDKKKAIQKIKSKDKTTGKKSQEKGLIATKAIDATDIKSFVGRDEIKKLEEELENADHYEECLRIYQEGVEENGESSESCESSSNEQSTTVLESNQDEEETLTLQTRQPSDVAPSKRRIAHVNATSSAVSLRKPLTARKRISTPAQMMMKRLQIIEQEKNNLSVNKTSGRIAHKIGNRVSALPKASLPNRVNKQQKLVNLEKKIQDNPWYPGSDSEPTVCGTATKGVARVAHKANTTIGAVNTVSGIPPRPRIAIERHSKVPNNIRQRYLTTFIDECLRICNNGHEKAYAMAQTEEENCKKRSNTKNIYLSLAASTLKRLREMPASKTTSNKVSESDKRSAIKRKIDNSVTKSKSNKVMSHGRLLDTNTKRCDGGYTIEKREEKSQLSRTDLYEKMCGYIMTPDQLDQNGYPRPSDVPGKAEYHSDPPPKPFNSTNKKTCVHCGKEFFLDKKGKFAREEECTHHWGRAYMTRVGKGWEKRYSCCQERIGSEGCTIGDTHVHADNKLDRNGFVKTLIKSPPPNGDSGIYTLDCEMSYTVNGLELTRVSVLDCDCKMVYDTMVKPSGRVLDYNTRWSGITEDDMKNVKTTIRDVQAVFLAKFSADTILMGHSLESDLVALRIIHETVVDTSIVFPHKRGLPYKRALRTISSEFLGLVIQNMASEGHDSAEDAAACMKLMLWKISEDCKLSQK